MTGPDPGQEPASRGTRPPVYVAELWVSAQLRERIQCVPASDQVGHPEPPEPDFVPEPDLEAEP